MAKKKKFEDTYYWSTIINYEHINPKEEIKFWKERKRSIAKTMKLREQLHKINITIDQAIIERIDKVLEAKAKSKQVSTRM